MASADVRAVPDDPATFLPGDPLLHLLRRATFGPSPASVARIRALGAAAWLDEQLSPAGIADPVCDDLVGRFPLGQLSITALRAAVRAGTTPVHGWAPMRELGWTAVARAIWSERQLFEVMVDFWSNHFNVTCPAGDVWDSRMDYDRTVIRRYAFGRFSDLLRAAATHPAMLVYLDNASSTARRPNENFGRECLELHTVGLGYTESDVKNAARLFSGMTVDRSTGPHQAVRPGVHRRRQREPSRPRPAAVTR